jgi:hypothetical protein
MRAWTKWVAVHSVEGAAAYLTAAHLASKFTRDVAGDAVIKYDRLTKNQVEALRREDGKTRGDIAKWRNTLEEVGFDLEALFDQVGYDKDQAQAKGDNLDYVKLITVIEAETAKAYKVAGVDGQPVWLPKSQVEVEKKSLIQIQAEITMPLWLAKAKGIYPSASKEG